MNWMGIAGLVLIIVCAGLMILYTILHRARPLGGLRLIPPLTRFRRAVNQAVEDGTRLHISLGSASILSPQTASALVGLSMLDQVTRVSAVSDRPPIATSGESGLAILSRDTLRSAYREANVLDQFDPTTGQLTGLTPFSYAVGAMPVMFDESVCASALVGHFGPEVVLITDAAGRADSLTLAASDALAAQAVLYATAQEPLIGEELFAGGAYMQAGPMHGASLRAQDILRWFLVIALLGGAFLKLVGIL